MDAAVKKIVIFLIATNLAESHLPLTYEETVLRNNRFSSRPGSNIEYYNPPTSPPNSNDKNTNSEQPSIIFQPLNTQEYRPLSNQFTVDQNNECNRKIDDSLKRISNNLDNMEVTLTANVNRILQTLTDYVKKLEQNIKDETRSLKVKIIEERKVFEDELINPTEEKSKANHQENSSNNRESYNRQKEENIPEKPNNSNEEKIYFENSFRKNSNAPKQTNPDNTPIYFINPYSTFSRYQNAQTGKLSESTSAREPEKVTIENMMYDTNTEQGEVKERTERSVNYYNGNLRDKQGNFEEPSFKQPHQDQMQVKKISLTNSPTIQSQFNTHYVGYRQSQTTRVGGITRYTEEGQYDSRGIESPNQQVQADELLENQGRQQQIDEVEFGSQHDFTGQIQTDNVEFESQRGQQQLDEIEFGGQHDYTGQIQTDNVEFGNQRGQHQMDEVEFGSQHDYTGQIQTDNVEFERQRGQQQLDEIEFGRQHDYTRQIQTDKAEFGNQRGQKQLDEIEFGRQHDYTGQIQTHNVEFGNHRGQQQMDKVEFGRQHDYTGQIQTDNVEFGNQRGKQQMDEIEFGSKQDYTGQQQSGSVRIGSQRGQVNKAFRGEYDYTRQTQIGNLHFGKPRGQQPMDEIEFGNQKGKQPIDEAEFQDQHSYTGQKQMHRVKVESQRGQQPIDEVEFGSQHDYTEQKQMDIDEFRNLRGQQPMVDAEFGSQREDYNRQMRRGDDHFESEDRAIGKQPTYKDSDKVQYPKSYTRSHSAIDYGSQRDVYTGNRASSNRESVTYKQTNVYESSENNHRAAPQKGHYVGSPGFPPMNVRASSSNNQFEDSDLNHSSFTSPRHNMGKTFSVQSYQRSKTQLNPMETENIQYSTVQRNYQDASLLPPTSAHSLNTPFQNEEKIENPISNYETGKSKANKYRRMESFLDELEKDLIEQTPQDEPTISKDETQAPIKPVYEYISDEEEDEPSFWSNLRTKVKNTYNKVKDKTKSFIADMKDNNSSEE